MKLSLEGFKMTYRQYNRDANDDSTVISNAWYLKSGANRKNITNGEQC